MRIFAYIVILLTLLLCALSYQPIKQPDARALRNKKILESCVSDTSGRCARAYVLWKQGFITPLPQRGEAPIGDIFIAGIAEVILADDPKWNTANAQYHAANPQKA